jgi:hypothetical protein
MILRVVLALLLFTAAAAEAQVGGRIVDSRTGDGVAGAFVHLIGVGGEHVATTDDTGRYRFARLGTGEYALRIVHPGYEEAALRVVLGAGRDVLLDVPLTLRPVPVARIVVAGERAGAAAAAGTTVDSVGLMLSGHRAASLAPQSAGSLADLVTGDMARDPPPEDGGRRPHVLYIWGSSAERGRVLLDGASINAPLHLGALLPPIDPDLLASANLRSGGISPRYDGGTTYVMDFATRSAAAAPHRAWGEADLLVTRLGIAAPAGEAGGIIVGARRVNDELVDRVIGRPFGYAYADALGRADAAFERAGRLHVTLFATREAISIPRDFTVDEAAWRNFAAALTWSGRESGARRSARATLSRGVADLPLLSLPGGHVQATMQRATGTFEQRWSVGGLGGTAGLEVEHLRFRRFSSADSDPTRADGAGAIACVESLPCFDAGTTLLAAWTEGSWHAGARTALRGGTRITFDPGSGRFDLLPRAALTTMLAANMAVSLSAGRFSQAYTTLAGEAIGLDAPGARTMPMSPAEVAVSHATHVELGMTRRAARSAWTGSIFVRRHDAVSDTTSAAFTPGIDVSWARLLNAASVTLGYSLTSSRTMAGDDVMIHQLLGIGLGGSRGPFHFNAATAYGHGMPLTSIVLDRSAVAEPGLSNGTPANLAGAAPQARAFVRVDAALGAEWRLRREGRDLSIVPYARIVNALSQRDALFYYHEAGAPGEPRPLGSLPAVPVIGVRWQF